MVEELLFRGYAFDRLKTLAGAPIALVLSSVAFGAYHLIGRPYWAIGAVFQGTGSTAIWTADVTVAQAHTLAAPDLLP